MDDDSDICSDGENSDSENHDMHSRINEDLIEACVRRDLEAVRHALQEGASVNYKDISCEGATPLHIAILEGSVPIIECLLGHCAEANALDDSGSAPLHLAADCGSVDTIQLLLDHGACVNAVDSDDSDTPLHIAVANEGGSLEERIQVREMCCLSCPTRNPDAMSDGFAAPIV